MTMNEFPLLYRDTNIILEAIDSDDRDDCVDDRVGESMISEEEVYDFGDREEEGNDDDNENDCGFN
eukprot:gnl/Chilomastix_caulleri/2884.p1 GENE.gnl/Chilomastix_caulleri/2884~~gnl/Chilomastix_caulleri/2884.p1  ORF type:complete len:66 (+),score=23.02 gnl/Chilomastix_caulleri/2884:275-472(+)